MSPFQFFLNLKLRLKLLFAFGSLLLLTVFLVVIFFFTLKRVGTYERASEEVDGVNLDILEMDAAVQYFIAEGYKQDIFQQTGTSDELALYTRHRAAVKQRLQHLDSSAVGNQDSLTAAIRRTLEQTDLRITELTALLRQRGFKDYGLEGKLRAAIHTVEKSPYEYDKADMLTLRRHEKDFFLRKDLKYRIEFLSKAESFQASIADEDPSENQHIILDNLRHYQQMFDSIVSIETKIGLTDRIGIKGQITQDLAHLRTSIAALRSSVKETSNAFKQRSMASLVIVFILELILGFTLAVAYAHIITQAVKDLQRAMQTLAEGNFPDPLPVKSREEIGKTKGAFNQLLDRLKAATHFAHALGKGDLSARYQDQYADDILARSLVTMQSQLAEAQQRNAFANWINSGVAQLNDVLHEDATDLELHGDHILKFVIQYVHANQGALYLMASEHDQEYLYRVATYAYDKKKYVSHRIESGQGLVSQCVLEKTPILLTEVPKDYIRITSGLGDATPRFVALFPLLAHGNAMGVLELASFQKLTAEQQQFLERVCENIGISLSNRRVGTETSRLLAEAREQTQRLMAQEEEIRQQAEYSQGLQDQLQREKQALENEVLLLKAKINYYIINASSKETHETDADAFASLL